VLNKFAMWSLWTLAQDTNQRPSELLNLSAWAADLIGMPSDWWTAFQFDRAVSWFGRHIEGKLQETETIGSETRQKHKLEDLLAETPVIDKNKASIEKYERMFGALAVINNG
jgi:hypothetical protein